MSKSENGEKAKITVSRNEIITLFKNTLIMLLITLVAGGILGCVYEVTKEPIARMAEQKKQEANKKVFADAVSFSDTMPEAEGWMAAFEYTNADITDCLEAYGSDGSVLGYVLEVTAHGGYGGDIIFQIGLANEGKINAISITSISETAGLGMRAEEVIVPQFRNRAALNFEVVKTGAVNESQIDAISSATITSKTVTNGVNAAVEFYKQFLEGGLGDE